MRVYRDASFHHQQVIEGRGLGRFYAIAMGVREVFLLLVERGIAADANDPSATAREAQDEPVFALGIDVPPSGFPPLLRSPFLPPPVDGFLPANLLLLLLYLFSGDVPVMKG